MLRKDFALILLLLLIPFYGGGAAIAILSTKYKIQNTLVKCIVFP